MDSPVTRSEMAFICELIENHISELNDYVRHAPRGEDISLERQNIFLFANLLERLKLPQPVFSIGEAKNMLLLTEVFKEDVATALEDSSLPSDLHNESVDHFKEANHIIRKLKTFIQALELSKSSVPVDS